MSTPSTVPMLAPTGEIGDVPLEKVNDAVNRGGMKMAQEMTSPDGQTGVIPFDQVHAAIAKGFTLKGSAPKGPKAPEAMSETNPERTAADFVDKVMTGPHSPLLRPDPDVPGPLDLTLAGAGVAGEQALAHAAETGVELAPTLPSLMKTFGAKLSKISKFLGIGEEEAAPASKAVESAAKPAAASAKVGKAAKKAEDTIRMVGEDGEVYDVPKSEVDALEDYKRADRKRQ